MQDVQESRKNATLGVSGDGVGGGNLGQITLEDIRFVGGDPINSNDLFVKDEPAWDARQNFIEGKKDQLGILKITKIRIKAHYFSGLHCNSFF